MKKNIFIILIIISAISISVSSGLYSIIGLSKLFSGAAMQVIIMSTCLEIGKILLTASLHTYWEVIESKLKWYLTFATIILMVITSAGVYGFLSDAYAQTAFKDDINNRKVSLIKTKKERFDYQIEEFKKEKEKVIVDINNLRNNLSTNVQTQSVDKRTGQLLTNTSSGNKSSVNAQIKEAVERRNKIEDKLSPLQDSSAKLEITMIETEASSDVSSELGPLKYISKISGISMDRVVNYFLLLLIFVFDPLALALIILAIQLLNLKDKPKQEEIVVEIDETDTGYPLYDGSIDLVQDVPTEEPEDDNEPIVVQEIDEPIIEVVQTEQEPIVPTQQVESVMDEDALQELSDILSEAPATVLENLHQTTEPEIVIDDPPKPQAKSNRPKHVEMTLPKQIKDTWQTFTEKK